jgi:hypothetical protein
VIEVIIVLIITFLAILALTSESEQEYGIKSIARNGEEVKSKAEKHLANYFHSQGIRYLYEKEARSQGIMSSKHISNPDFYLTDHDVYVEYWGLVDADDEKVKENYVRTMKWKMRQYYDNGIKFVSIYPQNMDNLDWIFRKKFSEVTGYHLPLLPQESTRTQNTDWQIQDNGIPQNRL